MHHHVLAVRAEVILLSLGAASLYALTSVLQHQSVSEVSSSRSMRPSLLAELVRQRRWLLSNGIDVAAFGLQFLALRAGSLVVVQTLLVSGLLIALPLGAAVVHRRPSLADWAATAAIATGLGLFLAIARPDVGAGEASAVGWVVVGGAGGIVIIGLTLLARHRRGPARAAALGTASGVLYGLTAAVAKASGHLLDRGLVHALGSWEPYALAALGLLGIVISQSAFQAGPLQSSLPLMTISDPLVASLVGVAAFHEHLAHHAWHVVGETAALLVLIAGVFALSQSPLVRAAESSS